MASKELLPFISNSDLYKYAKEMVDSIHATMGEAEESFYDNVIDPWLALFRTVVEGMDGKRWFELEQARQMQKTMENSMGNFHQGILSSVIGWEQAPEVVDVINRERKIIAEVKNKWNTTKGNHLTRIYDDLEGLLGKPDYRDYVGYYVEVIPKKPHRFSDPFTPSDNTTHMKREKNESIRVIDGASFYHIASGYPEALRMLYEKLPLAINEALGKEANGEIDPLICDLFDRAYGAKRLI